MSSHFTDVLILRWVRVSVDRLVLVPLLSKGKDLVGEGKGRVVGGRDEEVDNSGKGRHDLTCHTGFLSTSGPWSLTME